MFRRVYRHHRAVAGAPCPAAFHRRGDESVLLLETGIGRARAQAAVEWVLSRPRVDRLPYRPQVIIAAGYAGALQDHVTVGDVIVATACITPDGQRWLTYYPAELSHPHCQHGRLLTSTRLIASSDEKRRLGHEFDALAVDMESAAIARCCHDAGVPFSSIHAISDGVDTSLSPQLLSLLSGSQVSISQLAVTLARAPRLLREFWQLARQTSLASQRLATALGEVLRHAPSYQAAACFQAPSPP